MTVEANGDAAQPSEKREPRNPCDYCDGDGWVWEHGYGGEKWKTNCRCGQNRDWRDEE